MKIDEFANSVDPDEVAHNEPPHLDLHCLPSSLRILNMIQLGLNIFWKMADENFVICFSVVKELIEISLSHWIICERTINGIASEYLYVWSTAFSGLVKTNSFDLGAQIAKFQC